MMTLAEFQKGPLGVSQAVTAEVLKIEKADSKDKQRHWLALELSDSTDQMKASCWDLGAKIEPGGTYIFELSAKESSGKIYYNAKLLRPVETKTPTMPNVGAYSLTELLKIQEECLKGILSIINRVSTPEVRMLFDGNAIARLTNTLFIQATKSGIRIPAQREPGEDLPY